MNEIKVKFHRPDALMPHRKHDDDVGFDLFCLGEHEILPHEFVDIPVGISIELPPSHWCIVTGRSSAVRKFGLLVVQGIIDPGYRGELFVGVYNISRATVAVQHHTRLAQFIPFATCATGWQLTKAGSLSDTARGANGFGSTGSGEVS